MPLELAELAAGLPIAASFAMAGGISALREGRRRTALNEAVHELRRPLQAIALSVSAPEGRAEALETSVRLAAAAVDRLDCEINGGAAPESSEMVPLRQLVEAAMQRWQARASLEDRDLVLSWGAGDPRLPVDALGLSQALDNLISNGLEHGTGEVAIEARRVDRIVRVAVSNRERAKAAGSRRAASLRARISGRRRHGLGLRIVRRLAAGSGCGFHLRRRGDRCEAVLELPLPGGPR